MTSSGPTELSSFLKVNFLKVNLVMGVKSHHIHSLRDGAGHIHWEAGILNLTTNSPCCMDARKCSTCLCCVGRGVPAALLSAFMCGQRPGASAVMVRDFPWSS